MMRKYHTYDAKTPYLRYENTILMMRKYHTYDAEIPYLCYINDIVGINGDRVGT